MTKGTPKQRKTTTKTTTKPLISKCALRHLIKVKLSTKSGCCRNEREKCTKIGCLANEQTLTCAVCLQLLLHPVLTQCGHTFCLSCTENLAMNKYSCAICHDHEPTYNLHPSATLQKLVNFHLKGMEQEETIDYHRRNQQQEQKWMQRSVGILTEGMKVDYWNEKETIWKMGRIQGITKTGKANVKDTKTGDIRLIDGCSRGLAKLHYFTKEEIQEAPRNFPQPFRGNPFINNQFINPNRAERMGNFMFYMPEAIQPVDPWNFFFQNNEF